MMNQNTATDLEVTRIAPLKEIAETLNRSLDLSEALHDSLEIILKILKLKAGWVFLKSEDGNQFVLTAYHGLPPAMHYPGEPWVGPCRCNMLAKKDRLTEAVNIVQCSRLEAAEGDRGNLVYHASVPLETPRGQIGILNVATADGRLFSEAELQLLNAVGNQMGVAIERAKTFERTRAQRLQEQAALLRLSNALIKTRDLDSLVEQVVRVTAEIFAADLCLVLCPDPELLGEIHCSVKLTAKQRAFLQKPWTEAGAGSKLLELARSGHIQLNPGGSPGVTLFPVDQPVDAEDMKHIVQDQAVWDFWQETGCRSITMAPIQSLSHKEGIGLLIVAHKAQKKVTEAEVHLTNLFANQTSVAIEQNKLQEIRIAQESLEKELSTATEIQHSFLPRVLPKLPGWEIAARYQSARQVGGDFYDLISLNNGHLGIVIADVADKGVPAALVMALSRTLVRGMAREVLSPADALVRTNEVLMSEARSPRFVTLFYGVLNPSSGEMKFARAGHNPPFWCQASTKEMKSLLPPGIALGIMPNIQLQEDISVIEPNDVVVFYTDGVTEAMNFNNQEFTEERLVDLIRRNHRLSAEQLADRIQKDVESFTNGRAPSDDFTLVVLKRLSS